MTNSLSTNQTPGQQSQQGQITEIHVFDPHAEQEGSLPEVPTVLAFPGVLADTDLDEEFFHKDTDLDDGDDDPPPANSGAMGLPCHCDTSRFPKQLPFSLCAVEIVPDPFYGITTNDPDYIVSGQELIGLTTPSMALAVCDGYAVRPEMLATRFNIDPARVAKFTHLVVNHSDGREFCRRQILRAA